MTTKTKRRLGVSLSIFLVIGTIIITSLLMGMKKPAKRKVETENRITVQVLEIKNLKIQSEIEIIGKTVGKEKVEIFSEVNGVLENSQKDFLAGVRYQKGDILLKLNSDENYMNLISQRSRLLNLITKVLPDLKFDYTESYENWKSYLENFEMENETAHLPKAVNKQEKYFIAGQGIYEVYYNIKSLEKRQQKYTITAPFDGVVSQSNIKPGTLVMGGQKLGEFFNPSIYDLQVEINRNEIDLIKVNDKVDLTDITSKKSWTGYVERISDIIDNQTQTVKVYITVSGDGLREGLFLTGKIKTSATHNGVFIPRKCLVGKDEVFIIKDSIVMNKKIELVQLSEENCIVKGLLDGDLISLRTKGLHQNLKIKY